MAEKEFIEREAAIAVIEEKQKELCPVGMYSRHAVYGSDREKFDAWEEIIEAIEAIPAADVRPVKWIPVTERLPEKMQYVLVRYQNNDMAVASWFGGDEHIRFWRAMTDEGWCADCDTEPTHWMPLPQPPEEE